MNAQDTPAEPTPDLQLEIAHLLFIDVVGYTKLLVNEQIELMQRTQSNRPERPNVSEQRKQAANSVECRRETEWRSFSFAARKSRRDARWRLAGLCKIIRTFSCGWEFTAARSTESAM